MLTPYLEMLELISDSDYDAFVEVVSFVIINSNGNAGKKMRDAYYSALQEPDDQLRTRKVAFIESVRHAYVSASGD